jgi:8-oxo-dGTP pyrophosphatase MutT (NUDIX family)/phosphohistidine phosphatase SixA
VSSPVLAAGAVCWRVNSKGKVKVLLVYRTQHRDVSLPKGKVDPGETLPETAVREIAEETGLVIGLGPPLGVVEYPMPNGRDKVVYYWSAEVSKLARANSTFVTNDEIESLHWVTLDAARTTLSYPHDVDIIDRFAELYEQGRARTFAIIALRHGKAVSPELWDGPDATRPLMQRGADQSASVAHGIAAYRPAALVSSTAARCLATVAPTARITGLDVTENEAISQDAYSSRGEGVARVVGKRLDRAETVVLCSHGPVLPQILQAVVDATGGARGVKLGRAAALSTGEYAVLHVPIEHPETGIVAVEVHSPTV